MGDDDELLDYARRYFQAAARSTERRKMHVLVTLGLGYLKLAAQAERSRARLRRAKSAKNERQPSVSGTRATSD